MKNDDELEKFVGNVFKLSIVAWVISTAITLGLIALAVWVA